MTRKVAISVPDEVLDAVDAAGLRQGVSRSRVFSDAARAYLAEVQRRREVDTYIRSYRSDPETDDELVITDAFLRRSFEGA